MGDVDVDHAKLLPDGPVDILRDTVSLFCRLAKCWLVSDWKYTYNPSIVRLDRIVYRIRLGMQFGPGRVSQAILALSWVEFLLTGHAR